MQNTVFSRDVRDRGALYLQIAAGLRRNLGQGKYLPGDRLPALSDMAAELGVSLVTVRSAVALLEQEGLLQRQQGRGTFVRRDAVCGKSLVFDTGFASLLEHLRGKTATVLNASDGTIMPMVPPKIGRLDPPYHFMRRVHLTDGIPYAVINIHIRRDLYLRKQARFDREMVIPILAEMPEIAGGKMHQTISFTTADPETATHLELSLNAAIGDVQRVLTDRDGSAIYVGNTKYRGDFVNLEINFDIDAAPAA